jgi:GT2 family glycosyltransferase
MTVPVELSVVVPTRCRLTSLQRLLGALEVQDHPSPLVEIIVVVDGDPSTAAALSGRAGVRVLEQTHGGPAAARNLGIAHARGRIVVFLDDDVVPEETCLRRHAQAHAARPDLVAIGPMLPPPAGGGGSPWVRWEAASLLRQYADIEAGRWSATPRQLYTGNASVGREHLVRAGGFDESLRRAEDVELGWRLHDMGLVFEFHPEARVHHEAARPYRSWLGAAREYGRVDARMSLDDARPDVLVAAASEFHGRHALTRVAVRAALRQPRLSSVLPWVALPVAHLATACGLARVSNAVCGGIFNLLYWDGVRERLGGAAQVRSLIASRRPMPRPSPRVAR